jgi:hypothetical protein
MHTCFWKEPNSLTELLKTIETRKALLIEELLKRGVYKTSDEKHLYDATIKVLEDEFSLAKINEAAPTINSVST